MIPADETSVPAFARGVTFRHDNVRGHWMILAPERVLLPDQTAVEILRRIDGTTAMTSIIDALAIVFTAPRDLIARESLVLVDDLVRDGIVCCRPGNAG